MNAAFGSYFPANHCISSYILFTPLKLRTAPTKKKKKECHRTQTHSVSHSRERRPSVGKTGEEKDELALYKCLTSAAGRSSGGKKNGEVNEYEEQKGWVSSRIGVGGGVGGAEHSHYRSRK